MTARPHPALAGIDRLRLRQVGALPIGLAPRAFDFSTGVLPSGANFTRASIATRTDVTGQIAGCAVDVARFDFDPDTHVLRGLLLEGTATNALVQSAGFDQSNWIKNGNAIAAPAITSNAAIAPDGTMAAERIDYPAFDSANAANFSLTQQTVSVGAPRVLSIWLRGAAGGEKIEFAGYASSTYNLSTPSPLVLTTSWQRYSLVSATAAASVAFHLGLNSYNGVTLNQGAMTLYAWGAQVESGSAASTYVPTAGTSVTRSADALVLDWSSKGVPDGTWTVRYTFDDASTQDVATVVSGGTAAVPTNLNRRWLLRAEKIA